MTISKRDADLVREAFNAGVDVVRGYLLAAAYSIETHDFKNARPGDLALNPEKIGVLAAFTRAFADDAELLKLGTEPPSTSPVAPNDPPSPVAPAAAAVAE